uniref:Ribonuclease P protein subunit p20 n=1 Tax=Riptortus pedestris TaxID=329032 RepID=R4WPF2_RIPPE|nr:unkown protein [Riptortus pedestris]
MDEESSKSLPKTSHLKEYSKRQRYKSESNHVFRKRVPPRDTRRPNDIYVTNKSDFKGQLAQCFQLFDKGENEIVLHGLGAAIPRTVNLALQIEEKCSGTCEVDVQTQTTHLVDDLEPTSDNQEARNQTRSNSSVKIRIFKTNKPCSSP